MHDVSRAVEIVDIEIAIKCLTGGGGCHKQLLPNQVAQVSSGATAVCKPCGRMLYMPEDRTVGSQ